MKFVDTALIVIDNKIILKNILQYLYKFNFKKIIFLKNKNINVNLALIKKYNFDVTILNFKNIKFNYNLLKKEYISSHLKKTFFLLRTSKFANLNLFKLYKIFMNNSKKLVVTISKKKKELTNTEFFFLKKKLLIFYNFNFKNILKDTNYKLNYVNDDLIIVKKKISKKVINKFFSKIYSKSIILDRDGVINVNKGYVGFKKDFFFQNGAVKAIKYLNNNNYNIFVVSNQSGVARGYFTKADVESLHSYLKDTLIKNYCFINKIYYSPYHKDGVIKKYKKNSSCRKPGTKLFKILCNEWGIKNTKNIFMIGDQKSDIEFARNAKIKSALFKSGNLYNFLKLLV